MRCIHHPCVLRRGETPRSAAMEVTGEGTGAGRAGELNQPSAVLSPKRNGQKVLRGASGETLAYTRLQENTA